VGPATQSDFPRILCSRTRRSPCPRLWFPPVRRPAECKRCGPRWAARRAPQAGWRRCEPAFGSAKTTQNDDAVSPMSRRSHAGRLSGTDNLDTPAPPGRTLMPPLDTSGLRPNGPTAAAAETRRLSQPTRSRSGAWQATRLRLIDTTSCASSSTPSGVKCALNSAPTHGLRSRAHAETAWCHRPKPSEIGDNYESPRVSRPGRARLGHGR
jgi:hypothetical protein